VYTYHREIEIDSHRIKGPTEFDRDFTKTEIMGKELKDLYEKEKINLERIETVLADAELQFKQVKYEELNLSLLIILHSYRYFYGNFAVGKDNKKPI